MSEEQLKAMEPSAPLLVAEVRRLQIELSDALQSSQWSRDESREASRILEDYKKRTRGLKAEIAKLVDWL